MNAAAWHRPTIVQQKTGKPVQFELTNQTRDSLIAWLTHHGAGCETSCSCTCPCRAAPDTRIADVTAVCRDRSEMVHLGDNVRESGP